MYFTWGSWKFPRFPSFRFWSLYWNRKLGKLGNIYSTCNLQGMCFTWESWRSPRLPNFRFRPYTEIENSEIFKTVYSKECVLLEEVENFLGFQVFDFGPYTEIENLENSEIFKTIVYSKEWVLSEEVGNFRGFRVFDFGPYTEIENSENSGMQLY